MNTVPLWETQLAQAVTIQRCKEAAEAIRDANDLTNELLTKNAENLQEANEIVRTEMERGVFDIESVQQANADADRHHRGKPGHCRRGQGPARRGRSGTVRRWKPNCATRWPRPAPARPGWATWSGVPFHRDVARLKLPCQVPARAGALWRRWPGRLCHSRCAGTAGAASGGRTRPGRPCSR